MTRKTGLLHYPVYWLFFLLLWLFRLLPLSWALALGRAAGDLAYLSDRRRRRCARENLATALGYPPERADPLIRQVFRHFGMVAVETFLIWDFMDEGNWKERIRFHPRHLQMLQDTGGKAILVSAHLGNWECLGAVLGLAGIRCASIVRPIDNPLVNRYFAGIREKHGQRLIQKKGAIREAAHYLNQGWGVAILLDQDAGRHGTFVDFFGRPASTSRSAALLARMTGAPILSGVAYRVRGFSYQVELDDTPIFVARTDDQEGDIREATALLASRIEGHIRAHPEQWMWLHRRWKTRPPVPAPPAT